MKTKTGKCDLRKREKYLAGYVIEGTLCGWPELFHGRDFCTAWPRRPGYHPTVYKTEAEAEKVRRTIVSQYPTRVREYLYETADPANAKGMPRYSRREQELESVITEATYQ